MRSAVNLFVRSSLFFEYCTLCPLKVVRMSTLSFEGKVAVNENLLNLDITLLGGQSFRWRKVEKEWRGVAYNAYWILSQSLDAVSYKVFPAKTEMETTKNAEYFQKLLEKYFRLDFDLEYHKKKWRASHKHFSEIASNMKAVRLLRQEPLENIISFICSQNNHIQRISSMVNVFCSLYGEKIGTFNNEDVYTFPSLKTLLKHKNQLESKLRAAKFGYRAKFIAQSIAVIEDAGGANWLLSLRELPYENARLSLVTLPGVGFKVADCICLMSLNHLEAVPVDTHILKIARSIYMPNLPPTKSITPKQYSNIANHFRIVYGPFAGWAQAILFCSELQQFKSNNDGEDSPPKKRKKDEKADTHH